MRWSHVPNRASPLKEWRLRKALIKASCATSAAQSQVVDAALVAAIEFSYGVVVA
jgi:hypothetical protein